VGGAVLVGDVGELGEQQAQVGLVVAVAQRAEKMPGAPPRTSTQSPESSATAGRPVARARECALSSAFSAKVTPVSFTSGTSG
jgi:hypothetical protein